MGGVEDESEELAWTIAEALDGSGTAKVLHALRKVHKDLSAEEEQWIPNPFFLGNGHSGRSPATQKYFRYRSRLNLFSSGTNAVSVLSGVALQVDAVGIATHTSAVGSTSAHLAKLHAIAQSHKKSDTIQKWIKAVEKAKFAKLAIRSTELAGAAIPIGAVGLSTSIAATLAKAGVKLTMATLIGRVAQEIHWRAFQEVAISKIAGGTASKPQGPASAVMHEIFTKRGLTRVFGTHDVGAIISEPAGYMALNDKLMLI